MVMIYTLLCEQNKYYIGKSKKINIRIEDHFDDKGSAWTKLYKPIDILEIKLNCDSFDEDKITLQYMQKFGINNVRGGSFTKIHLDDNDHKIITKMINGASDKCHLCGKQGHFINDCSDKNKLHKPKIKSKKEDKCYRCHRLGHYIENCYAQTDSKGNNLDDSDDETKLNKYDECFNCGNSGHYAKNCYLKAKKCNSRKYNDSTKKNYFYKKKYNNFY